MSPWYSVIKPSIFFVSFVTVANGGYFGFGADLLDAVDADDLLAEPDSALTVSAASDFASGSASLVVVSLAAVSPAAVSASSAASARAVETEKHDAARPTRKAATTVGRPSSSVKIDIVSDFRAAVGCLAKAGGRPVNEAKNEAGKYTPSRQLGRSLRRVLAFSK
ncbi:MAG: hypothetical protein AAGG46_04225 [Planctomycetota bacterium]